MVWSRGLATWDRGPRLLSKALCADPKIDGREAFLQELGEKTDKQALVSLLVRVQLAAERAQERERAAQAVRSPAVARPSDMCADPVWYLPSVCGPASCECVPGVRLAFAHSFRGRSIVQECTACLLLSSSRVTFLPPRSWVWSAAA